MLVTEYGGILQYRRSTESVVDVRIHIAPGTRYFDTK